MHTPHFSLHRNRTWFFVCFCLPFFLTGSTDSTGSSTGSSPYSALASPYSSMAAPRRMRGSARGSVNGGPSSSTGIITLGSGLGLRGRQHLDGSSVSPGLTCLAAAHPEFPWDTRFCTTNKVASTWQFTMRPSCSSASASYPCRCIPTVGLTDVESGAPQALARRP